MMLMTKTYTELVELPTFLERFRYLKLGGNVGEETFGCKRYLNQTFYRSAEWRKFRRQIILRDRGCDLGCKGFDIYGKILIHHIIPITEQDILDRSYKLLDPDNAICVSHKTHEAIHYGDESLLAIEPTIRHPNDMIPWRT